MAISRTQVEKALEILTGEFGPKAKKDAAGLRWVVSGGGLKRAAFSSRLEELERDDAVLPLEPTAPQLRQLAEGLWRTGERLLLVIVSHQRGAFRSSVALWVGNGVTVPVQTLTELEKLVKDWDWGAPCGWSVASGSGRGPERRLRPRWCDLSSWQHIGRRTPWLTR